MITWLMIHVVLSRKIESERTNFNDNKPESQNFRH